MSTSYAVFVKGLQLETWMHASMNVLAIYEYLITLDREVSSIWRRKANTASLLLLTTRWTMVLGATVSYIPSPTTLAGCKAATVVSEFLSVFMFFLVALFSALRAYALWNRSIALFTAVFLLGFTPVVLNTYRLIKTVYPTEPNFVCIEIANINPQVFMTLVRAARIPVIVGDALVVAVTWVKSFRQLRDGRRYGIPVPLSTLLFRDGTIYFLLLLLMNALELCPDLPESGLVFGPICNTLPPILINRFMLNLRQLSDAEVGSADSVRAIETPVFRARVSMDMSGNMGELLESLEHVNSIAEEDRERTGCCI